MLQNRDALFEFCGFWPSSTSEPVNTSRHLSFMDPHICTSIWKTHIFGLFNIYDARAAPSQKFAREIGFVEGSVAAARGREVRAILPRMSIVVPDISF